MFFPRRIISGLKFHIFLFTISATVLQIVHTDENATDADYDSISPLQPDIFTTFGVLHTAEQLEYWTRKEDELVEIFEKRSALIDKEIELITRWLEDYEESSGKALLPENVKVPADTPDQRGRIIGSSAVLGHLMTDRYVSIIDPLRKLLDSPQYREVEEQMERALEVDEISQLLGKSQWPDSNDLLVSHVAILNIQEMYGLKPKELSMMMTNDTNFGGTLDAFLMSLIGVCALKLKFYHMAIEWLEFSYELLMNDENDHSISADLVEDLLLVAAQTHNRRYFNNTQRETKDREAVNFYLIPYYGLQQSERETYREDTLKIYGKMYGNGSYSQLNALNLCAGEEFQPIEIRSKMTCYLEKKIHPYFILNPVKAEKLSEYPLIIQFYDVLGNDSIQEMYRERDELRLSTVLLDNKPVPDVTSRTSAGTVMPVEFDQKIKKKSWMLTGLLSTRGAAEALQTAEYVYGRMYHVHADTLYFYSGEEDKDWEASKGDRVATILYYADASPDLIGGNTPFCEVGIFVKPIRGSAVFWFVCDHHDHYTY